MADFKEKGNKLLDAFDQISVSELEKMILISETREERAIFRSMINLKLQLMQEKVTGEVLL